MRLSELREYLAKCLNDLDFKGSASGANKMEIYNNLKTVEALEKLADFKFLKQEIEELKSVTTIYYARTMNTFEVGSIDFNRFHESYLILVYKINAVIDLLSQYLPKEDPNSINVKFENTNELKEVSQLINTLDKALNQLLNIPDINGKAELINVQPGSIWFNIAVGTSVAIPVIAGAVWSSVVIYKKVKEVELVQKSIEAFDVHIDAMNAIKEGLENQVSALCETEARQLLEGNNINFDPETLNRVKHTIKMFSELIKNGVEIHHPLAAPEDVKNLFPDYSKIGLIESKIKLLKEE